MSRALVLALLFVPAVAGAQQPASVQLPTVVVTAQKEPADPARLPISVTPVRLDLLTLAGAPIVSDAAIHAPNTYFHEFTARKLSNPRFRGVGSSPANPGVTTFVDGVPQLNANTANIDLLDVSQVEFVRGPQSALFGRNVLGGLVNVATARPSLTEWRGTAFVPIGNESARDIRAAASGPIAAGRAGVGVALGYGTRDGFTTNTSTGRTIDDRSAFAIKGQLLWTPARDWETRVVVSGERARDGDYALHDLGSLRRAPFVAARDFEGHTHRDIVNTTVLARREGSRVTLSSTTGFVSWQTDDATDLDYTAMPLVTRRNVEDAFQFTQEVRLASAPNAAVRLGDRASLRWQAGVFLFTQSYEQDAANTFAPFLLSRLLGVPVQQTSPQSELDDAGVGLYGQGTVTLRERFDVTGGLRVDHEAKDARLSTFFTPTTVAPPRDVVSDRSFSNVSPQVAVAYRPAAGRTVYAAVSSGFKAGGFNPASPPGFEAYTEEHTWHAEAGVKSVGWNGRLSASAALFFIDWDDLQLNVPDPAVPGQFYIANVGAASSRGVELELNARVLPGASGSSRTMELDLFGAFGYTHARFGEGSVASGVPVEDHELPNTPDFTATVGAQLARAVRGASVYARGETVIYGAYFYDESNTEGQDAYALTNLRAGARGGLLFGELWIRNAFDTRYIPVAFPYLPFAQSGFVGEMGRPRTFGVSVGVSW
jgi:iron complex outermembrane receptor protein